MTIFMTIVWCEVMLKITRPKSSTVAIAAIGLFQLTGCVSNPEQRNADSLQALNIYDDNLVVLRASSPSTNLSYSINSANQVVAYRLIKPGVGQVYLNAVDIAQLKSVSERKDSQVNVTLRNGEQFKSSSATIYICDNSKKCSTWNSNAYIPLPTFYEQTLFGKKTYGLDDYKTFPISTFNFDKSSTQTINIDSGAEAAKFNNDTLPQARARMKQRWDKSLVETEKKMEEQRQATVAAEAAAVSRRKVDCTSRGFSLTSPMANYSENTILDCDGGKFRSTVGDMRAKGWSISNVNTVVVSESIASPAHTKHNLFFVR